MIRFEVVGLPGPQGSKRHVGGGRMIESSAKVWPWREAVKWAAYQAQRSVVPAACLIGAEPAPLTFPLNGPLVVRMVFTLPKPTSAPRRRTTWPDRKPDLSKLVRSTEDALTDAGLWMDDARVVELYAAKRYPGEGADALAVPGCVIEIRPL